MDLTIELSFDIIKNREISSIQNELSDLCEKNNCVKRYFTYEIEGESTYVSTNECILTVNFDKLDEIINFMKEIQKKKYLKIDCIYRENKKSELEFIYTSKKYCMNNSEHNQKKVKSIYNKREIIDLLKDCVD